MARTKLSKQLSHTLAGFSACPGEAMTDKPATPRSLDATGTLIVKVC